jgi:mycofactocin precursor
VQVHDLGTGRRGRAPALGDGLSTNSDGFPRNTGIYALSAIMVMVTVPTTPGGNHMTAQNPASQADNSTSTETELVTESLVEEVSIDGMCGVY